MKHDLKNENGVTLLELLVSITLLSIVILTFLGFFTNAFRFNTVNSDSLQAMNVAREYKATFTDRHSTAHTIIEKVIETKNTNISVDDYDTLKLKKPISVKNGACMNGADYYLLELNDPEYEINACIKITSDSHGIEGDKAIHQLHVEVYEDQNKEKRLSDTYSYIEVQGEG